MISFDNLFSKVDSSTSDKFIYTSERLQNEYIRLINESESISYLIQKESFLGHDITGFEKQLNKVNEKIDKFHDKHNKHDCESWFFKNNKR